MTYNDDIMLTIKDLIDVLLQHKIDIYLPMSISQKGKCFT